MNPKHMQTAKRVAINTVVLYAKILISMAISLITVPMVLHALGQKDYGLNSLVAGVVAMLSFLNNSMSVSTQRYMSVAMGEGDNEKINRVFNINILLHLIIGLFVVLVLEIIGVCFLGKLNIEPESLGRAQIIYQFLIVATFTNIICVPLNGVINAREDLVVFSIIGVFDSLLILALVMSLSHISVDRLIYYSGGMMVVPIITFIITYIFVRKAYPEYQIKLKYYFDKGLFNETFKFSGWNLLGGVSMVLRNQGVAIVINLFLGTIANAAYGIANQINGACSHFSSTFQKAINPQLMKSEGMKDHNRMNRISFISSKYSVLALCIVAAPLILEMPEVLQIWLRRDIPPFTVRLSQFILLFTIVFQYSSGLMSAIQATGKIRDYQIIMSVLIMLNLPAAYLILKLGYPIYYCTAAFVVLELITLVVRIFFAQKLTGMRVPDYNNHVIKPTFITIAVSLGVSLIPHFLLPESLLRLIVVCGVFGCCYVILLWFVALEKEIKVSIINKFRKNE